MIRKLLFFPDDPAGLAGQIANALIKPHDRLGSFALFVPNTEDDASADAELVLVVSLQVAQ